MKNVSEIKENSAVMGKRIKRARMLAGLSRKDLESKHEISVHTLQSWELGRNPLNRQKAANLVEVFHQYGVSCSIEWLLDGAGKGPSMIDNDFTPYPFIDDSVGNLLASEQSIQKEIDFFKTNNPNAVVVMVSDDAMEPEYKNGDFVGGINYIDPKHVSKWIGHDCIVEMPEGLFFRRLIQSDGKYLLVCNNAKTSVSDPVIFAEKVLSIAPVVWHRWKYDL